MRKCRRGRSMPASHSTYANRTIAKQAVAAPMLHDEVARNRRALERIGYKDEFCELVINMGEEGISPEEFAGNLGIGYARFNECLRRSRDFLAAFDEARAKFVAFWGDKARGAALHGSNGDTKLLLEMVTRSVNHSPDPSLAERIVAGDVAELSDDEIDAQMRAAQETLRRMNTESKMAQTEDAQVID